LFEQIFYFPNFQKVPPRFLSRKSLPATLLNYLFRDKSRTNLNCGPHTLHKWLKSFTSRCDSSVSCVLDHESALGDRADLPIGVLGGLRQRVSDSERELGEDADFRHCPCVQRRFCPQNNTVKNLPRRERSQYLQVPVCYCECAYCIDSPTLRTNLFPQSEAYGMTPVLISDTPGVNRLNYGDTCYDNQRLEGFQIVTRNLQLMYQTDPGRHTYAIRVPCSDGSGKTVKQKVFESKSGWGSDSEEESSLFESVLNFDDVARSNLDELVLQPTKVRRLNGYKPLSAEEFPSVRLGSFKDVNGLTRVSF
jgi:hypothetical protein